MNVDSSTLKRCLSAPHIECDDMNSEAPNSLMMVASNHPNCQTVSVGAGNSNQVSSSECERGHYSPGGGPSTYEKPTTITSPVPGLCKAVFGSTSRTRRFSTNCSPIAASTTAISSPISKLVPRISQLRQEEGADIVREICHEREMISDNKISQSYEELNILTEGWSTRHSGDDNSSNGSATNPLHLNLSSLLGGNSNSPIPSPTRHCLRFPYANSLTPSPTRRFTTRRSMSPVTIRPSQLGGAGVKRKFELDDASSSSYSPPLKKILSQDRNPSPSSFMRQTPSPLMCPSPDSCTSDRVTPRKFTSRLLRSSNTPSTSAAIISTSLTSSPATETSSDDAGEMDLGMDDDAPSTSTKLDAGVSSTVACRPKALCATMSVDEEVMVSSSSGTGTVASSTTAVSSSKS